MPTQSLVPPDGRRAVRTADEVSWRDRLMVRLFAGRFDETLAFGCTVAPGTALSLHAARLTSDRERCVVVRTLRRVSVQARQSRPVQSATVAVHRANVIAAEDAIDAVVQRLRSPLPVSAMGMARLRRLLTDGTGPMYAGGRGDLDGRLRAALSEL
ncbi:hypothetical protein [Mycobacterium sp. ACS4331]|uniref:hypothetical protein n=1 Tax=Mycobacterium sp. ACS4331 TaxID=1834121 RepID=UPI000ADBDE61|nr:hypothetical protein [Mycobacterium sp. ACS4331]